MARIDLVDMLIQFYRIGVKTTLWNMIVFWHMVDIAKLNAWLLYYRHQKQKCIFLKQQKTLVHSSKEFSETLVLANKSLNDQTKKSRQTKTINY